MPKTRSVDDYFKLIKDDHKKYLEQKMVTHLELVGDRNDFKLIAEYSESIKSYHESKTRYLNGAIAQLSTSSKIGHGVLAGLLGIGAGGAAFYAQQGVAAPLNTIAPLGAGKDVVAGVFSSVLAAGVSLLVYNAWKKSAEKVAAVSYQQFSESMKAAGFTNEKYTQLSAEIVKLFHFRECLLLDLKDSAHNKMRKEFIATLSTREYDDKALNVAIEAYFLAQLNDLFNEAFRTVYIVQDQQIKEEKEQSVILTWIKNFFANPEERATFTQELQIEFMDQCLNYFEAQMIDPGFFAKYSYATASISGLIAGAIALGVAVVALGGPIGIGIGSIGLVAVCVTAVASYFAVNHIESLQYSRSKENRGAIQKAIHNVTTERDRLNELMKNGVETKLDDIRQLEQYKNEGRQSVFNLFGERQNIAMGAETAWVREYASRYRHSKMIEIDLSKTHREIIEKGQAQTSEMQKYLCDAMNPEKMPGAFIRDFIRDTTDYLRNANHKDFITQFGLINKIKQQFLEIVAGAPANEALPDELVTFYTSPVDEGGLGGLAQDLGQARNIASTVNPQAPTKLLIVAQRLNYALSQDRNHQFILKGNDTYRSILGLSVTHPSERIEDKINDKNIQNYLNQSFNFLLSLNKATKIDGSNLEQPFVNGNEFVLYRMLLIKQLADLADPNNVGVNPSVKKDIERFVQNKLQLDPKATFREVQNHALFITEDKKGPTLKDPLGQEHVICDIEHVAAALRLDLAYSSKPMTPKMLIDLEIQEFSRKQDKKNMFCYVEATLIPDVSEDYVSKIKKAIEATNELIAQLKTKNVLIKSGALASYIYEAHQKIIQLRGQIEHLKAVVDEKQSSLKEADQLLKTYQEELSQILETNKPTNIADSTKQFGAFGKVLNLSSYDDWEVLRSSENKSTAPTLTMLKESYSLVLLNKPDDLESSYSIVFPEGIVEEMLKELMESVNEYLTVKKNVSAGFFEGTVLKEDAYRLQEVLSDLINGNPADLTIFDGIKDFKLLEIVNNKLKEFKMNNMNNMKQLFAKIQLKQDDNQVNLDNVGAKFK